MALATWQGEDREDGGLAGGQGSEDTAGLTPPPHEPQTPSLGRPGGQSPSAPISRVPSSSAGSSQP